MRYMTYQVEAAPTTGQLHLQGCLRLLKPARLQGVKKMMKEPTIHLEVARAWAEAKKYSNKPETRVAGPWEYGEDMGQGARSDIHALCGMVRAGKRDREIAEEHPALYMRLHKGVGALRSALARHCMRPNLRVALFWGATGTGKTWTATQSWGEEEIYSVFDVVTPWFDGYQGQRIVIFDEMGPGCMDVNKLKRFLDKYSVMVPMKGSSAILEAETIVLTSNSPIHCWYPHAREEDLTALQRRMKVFKFPDDKLAAERWCRGEDEVPAAPTWGLLTRQHMDIWDVE